MSEIHHNGNHHPADHHHGHPTETPDVSHIRNVDVTHELSDVSVEGVLKFIVGLTIMTAVTLGLIWALFKVLNSEAAKKDVQAPPGPMARTEEERRPPEPRLQEAPGFGVKLETGQLVPLDSKHAPGQPQAEYRVLREQWEETLEKGKTDPTGKLVALPIGEAMKKLLEGESLPVRPEAKNTRPDDYAIKVPTAASSGRVLEKKQ